MLVDLDIFFLGDAHEIEEDVLGAVVLIEFADIEVDHPGSIGAESLGHFWVRHEKEVDSDQMRWFPLENIVTPADDVFRLVPGEDHAVIAVFQLGHHVVREVLDVLHVEEVF